MCWRGHRYEATEAGLATLGSRVERTAGPSATPRKGPDLFRMVRELRETVRRQLQEYLLGMDPIRFEELIKVLLEEMGYEHLATTAPSNDKGVDVVGTIELGISAVREVVQEAVQGRHRPGRCWISCAVRCIALMRCGAR
ncbi:MAG: restriction endonuclease [Anaerolineales bacterium]|nr:restriction endonuclease [Anaerolineales bacterium]